MFPLVGLLTINSIILFLLAAVMVCLSNTFAVANKDKMRSGDDSQQVTGLQLKCDIYNEIV